MASSSSSPPAKRARLQVHHLDEESMRVFRGCVVRTPSLGEVVLDEEATVVVDGATGRVARYFPTERKDDPEALAAVAAARNAGLLRRLGPREMLLPGFVDCHIHAPQYSYVGTGLDLPLMGPEGWLERYTFPSERSLGRDPEGRARAVYRRVVARTLQNGTTSALYFGSLDAAPNRVLAESMHGFGQRGFLGKVCMDRNSPADYCAGAADNLAGTNDLIDFVKTLNAGAAAGGGKRRRRPLLGVAITPRFVPTCSLPLLRDLGALAAKYQRRPQVAASSTSVSASVSNQEGDGDVEVDVMIQTHVAESADEVAFCRALHPPGSIAGFFRDDVTTCQAVDTPVTTSTTTTKIAKAAAAAAATTTTSADSETEEHGDDGRDLSLLARCGLITNRTVLAHGVHLSPAEVAATARAGAAVAHCPLSNCYFADGALPVRRLLAAGVKVGLGSDVAGGHDVSMLSAIRSAVLVSRLLSTGVDRYDHGSARDASSGSSSTSTSTSTSTSNSNSNSSTGTNNEATAMTSDAPEGAAVAGEGWPAVGSMSDRLTWQEALFLATVGGAQALGLQDRVGHLQEGFEFDALLVSVGGESAHDDDDDDDDDAAIGGGDSEGAGGSAKWAACDEVDMDHLTRSRVDVFPSDSRSDLLQKFLHCGDDRDIREVWVQGSKKTRDFGHLVCL